MTSSGHDEVRDYGFADKALALRKRAGLTQGELAALLGVSFKTIGGWENGLFAPSAERLEQLIALYVEHGALQAEGGVEEAEALWEAARRSAARRLLPFDPRWFASLHGECSVAVPAAPPSPAPHTGRAPRHDRGEAPATAALRHDWGEAPAAAALRGRTEELARLVGWVRDEGCRVVEVVGAGGIGKTALAARLAHALAPEFPVLHWRSLRNAPPVEEWLAGAISALSAAQALPPEGFEARLTLMLALLRGRRALLVLDNLETILEPGAAAARYRAGYGGYGEALRRLAEGGHRGCLLLTSREQPLRADEPAVRALHLAGLGVEDGRTLLAGRGLAGDEAAWVALVGRYGGNPLALKVVGETIEAIFGGDVAAFVSEEAAVFGDIRELLDEQVERLSPLERSLLYWLAVEREPVGFAELAADLGPGVRRAQLVEAVEGLRRRSLLEAGGRGAFTLQPVVLEYATDRLVAEVGREVAAGEPALLLVSHALVKATAREYVRRSQERLIAQPLLETLRSQGGGAAAVERRLPALLEIWRGRLAGEQGYGPGNVVNLLRLLRGDLRWLDLSRLHLRQAYLAEVEAQDTSLVGSQISETVLGESSGPVTSIAISADGVCVAAGTAAGDVQVWRVADRAPLLALRAGRGGIYAVAFSTDGRLLASGDLNGTVNLWQVESGRPLAILQGHTAGVTSVAFSPDGRTIASGSVDGTVRLWEVGSGRPLATLQGHTGGVEAVAFSADGRSVASASFDGTLRLWEAASGLPLATLEDHTAAVMDVAFSADGRTLASGSLDGTIQLWEAESGRPLATLKGHSGGVIGVAFSADGRTLASGSDDRTIRLWEGASGRPIAVLEGHTGPVWGVAFSADGRLLVSGSLDGTMRLWEVEGDRPLATLRGHTDLVWGVVCSPDGLTIASGSLDGTVNLWEVEGDRPLATLRGHTAVVWGVACSPDGGTIASCSLDRTVRLWEAESGRPLATLQGHTAGVAGVAFSADGRMLASGSFDGTVRLWEAGSGRPLATLEGHTAPVNGVAFSADGRTIASGSADGTVRLWEAPSGRPLATLQDHTGAVRGVAWSPVGQLLASGGQDGAVRLWEAESFRLLATLQGHAGLVDSVAFSADGRTIASASLDGSVRLWEAESGRPLATLRGHTAGLTGVAFSGDGRILASGGLDGAVICWDPQTFTLLRTLRSDRPYERLDITGLTGVTEAQRAALLALGAVERSP